MAADGSVVIEITGDADDFEKSLNDVAKAASDAAKPIEDFANTSKKSISEYRKDVMELAQTYKSQGMSMSDAMKKAYSEIDKSQYETQKSAQGVSSGFDEIADSAKGAGDSFGSFDSMFQASFLANLAEKALSAVVDALKSIVSNTLEAGQNFTSSMSQVAATMGMTVDEIHRGSEAYETLQAAAKEAGATTAYSASEAADALNYLALAGYSAEQAADALPAVLNLAAAGGLDLAYASDLATDAMSALGIEASNKNLTQFGDQMAKTASKANTSVAQLGEAILTVGGTAKDLAGGTVELNAALGVLANRGIKGAEGGTHLRNVILSLSSPTDQARKKLDQLGIAVYDADGHMRNLNDIFQDFNASLGDLSDSERQNALSEIFNKTDLSSVQAILAGCGEEFDNLALAIENSSGAMQDMADTQLDNLSGDLQMLNSATEGLYLNIYNALEPALRSLTQAATAVVGWVSDLVERSPALVTTITGAAVAVGVLAVAMGGYTIAAKAATAAAAAFNLASAATLGPIIAVTAAVGALVGVAAGLAREYADAYKATHEELYAITQETDALIDKFAEMKSAHEEAMGSIAAESDNVLAMSSALDELINKEEQTAADKAAILELVNQLNAAILDLNLAYDEQTNSLYDLSTGLKMTAADLEQYALAEAHRQEIEEKGQYLSDLYVQRKKAVNNLANAQELLNDAIARQEAAQNELNQTTEASVDVTTELRNRLAAANEDIDTYKEKVKEAQGALDNLNDEIEVSAAEYDELNDAVEENQKAIEENTDAVVRAYVEQANLADVLNQVTDSYDILKTAQDETTESGNISLSTLQSLLNEYPELERYLEETADGYALSKGALEDYIDTQKAQYQIVYDNAESAAQEIIDSEALKAKNYDLATMSIKAQLEAMRALYSAQIGEARNKVLAQYGDDAIGRQMAMNDSAVKQAQNNLKAVQNALDDLETAQQNLDTFERAVTMVNRSYTSARSTGSSAAATAAEEAKTQAEQDLETFKSIQNELDHLRTMEEISEQEYRDRLKEARDTYLTDDANLEQYKKTNEEIYKLDKQLADEEAKLQEEAYKNRLAALQESFDREEITFEEFMDGWSSIRQEFLDEDTEAWQDSIDAQEEAVRAQIEVVKGLEDNYEAALGGVKDAISGYLSGITADYESALKDLQTAQANMASKLSDVGDLFTITTDQYSGKETFTFTSLQDSIDAINAYEEALESLKERGISGSLMQEVLGMSTEDATKYANELMKMTDDQFDDYLSLWEEKETRASEVAEKFYADDIQSLEEDYANEMVSILEELPGDLYPLGVEALAEYGRGAREEAEEVVETYRELRESVETEVEKLTEYLRDSIFAETLSFSSKLEVSTNAASERENIASNKQAAQIADNMVLANGVNNDGSTEIVLKLEGTEVGRILLPYMRAAEDQSPRIVSD